MQSPLIDPAELAERLEDPRLRVCDVRWYLGEPERGAAEFAAGHIPTARFVDLERVLSAADGPGRHPLPRPDAFAASLGELGISPDDVVVAYDAAGGATAARLWWMLRAIGHPEVAVLDGGFGAWLAAGGESSRRAPDIGPAHYSPTATEWPGTVSVEEVMAQLDRAVLVDARAEERYAGRVEPVDPRAGHIPGAVNRPHTANLGRDGRYLPPDALRERYRDVGDRPIVYCGSGVTACADILAMEVAGIGGARLYPGSWSDWASDPRRPAETA